MTVKFAPDDDRRHGRRRDQGRHDRRSRPARRRSSSTIDGLDTSRVSKIESFTVKQGRRGPATGELEPTQLEIPNLAIWVDPAGAARRGATGTTTS